MAVQGEKYLVMMGYIHFLCLLFASRRMGLPLRPARAAAACLFASVYSLAAWLPGLPFSGGVYMMCALFSTGMIAFGKRGKEAFFPQLMFGLLCAGLCGFLMQKGAGAPACLLCCTALCRMPAGNGREKTAVRVMHGGRACRVPCIRDTGNTLRCPYTGLPVMVVGEKRVRAVLPEGFPEGCRQVTVRTVQGQAKLPLFIPDSVVEEGTGRLLRLGMAVSSQPLPLGLLPGAIGLKEEKGKWKKRIPSGKGNRPSVSG